MYYLKIVRLGRGKHYTVIILVFERQFKNSFLNVDIVHSLGSCILKCVVEPEKLMRGSGNDQRCKMASIQEQLSK